MENKIKKVVPYRTPKVTVCPDCGTFLMVETQTHFCRWCGYPLDWAEYTKNSTTKPDEIPILCLDMDGVLAVWDDYYTTFEEMTRPGFYETLPPAENVLKAIKLFIQWFAGQVSVHILSAAYNETAVEEKKRWLDRYLPEILPENRHFVLVGEDKAAVFAGHDMSHIALLDDYTKNLKNWKIAGGHGIKLLNGENNVSGKWLGDYVYYRTEPEVLAKTLFALVNKGAA